MPSADFVHDRRLKQLMILNIHAIVHLSWPIKVSQTSVCSTIFEPLKTRTKCLLIATVGLNQN